MKSIKRILSALLVTTMLFCGVFTATAGATAPTAPIAEATQGITIEPFASEHIAGWTPLLSRTMYGARVTLTNRFSGTLRVELQNSAGTTIASFTESFTNANSVTAVRDRATPAGTYRIRITVTISGTATTRTSDWLRI